MKQGTKVFICLLCVVLATLITVACIFCIYYPHYKQNQHAAVIEDKPLERGEMRIMSCNLRCANVMDTGKRAGSTAPISLSRTSKRKRRLLSASRRRQSGSIIICAARFRAMTRS